MDTSDKIVAGGLVVGGLYAGYKLFGKKSLDKSITAKPFFANLFGQQTEQSIANIAQSQITTQQEITSKLTELEAQYNKNDADIIRLEQDISILKSQIEQEQSTINIRYDALFSQLNQRIINSSNRITLFTKNLIQLEQDYKTLKYVAGFGASYQQRKSTTQNELNNERNTYNNLQTEKTNLINEKAQLEKEKIVPLQQKLSGFQQILITRKIAQDEIQKQIMELKK
jgi:predicted nuclease with TOPRIM domain